MSSTDPGVTPPAAKPKKAANPVLEQWRVTIQRVRPQLIGLLVFTLGLVVGLGWAYGIAPTIWTNAEPIHLHSSYQDEWVKMVADQYSLFGRQGQAHAEDMLRRVGNAQATIDRLIGANQGNSTLVARLNAIREFAPGADNPELQKIAYSWVQTLNPAILVAAILIIGALLIILWGMYSMAVGMIIKGLLPSRNRTDTSPAMSEASRLDQERRRIAQQTAQRAQQAAQQAPPPGSPAAPSVPPLKKYVSTYLLGDDYYDESFSIEDNSGGFLGETGAGISETVSVGTPKKVTALELWLFDKNDIRTVTKVLMTEHAYQNDALRNKLAPKGEAVLARPGALIELETQTLRIIVTILDMKYGSEATPSTNSYFENLTFEIAAYAKEGATSAPGTAIGNMYTSDNMPPL
ncbi:MAG: hypothetical protein JXN59_04265 [Anaerolineae bacterium]|nr:hypothetical protein [Anaerolineae bacterium]